jgi:hypothetical protein
MGPYKPTQHVIYEDRINAMAKKMVVNQGAEGSFPWQAANAENAPIIIGPDNEIIAGHHRLIAAQMAAQQTGRPLTVEMAEALGRPPSDAIIPKDSLLKRESAAMPTTSWNSITIEPSKPVIQMPDPRADKGWDDIRDLFPLD